MTVTAPRTGRASAWLASGTVISRLMGFVKVMVLAKTIGAVGVGANAFALANSLPNNLYLIIAGGVVNAMLVPHIVRAARNQDGGLSYINKLITLTALVLGVATLLAFVCTPAIVSVYAFSAKSSADGASLALAIALGYWCMPQLFFYGMYTVLGEVLNARSMFGPFTWAPIINNVIGLAGLVAFTVLFGADPNGTATVADWSNQKIMVLGGSTTLGVIAQACILLLFWRRAGLRFRFDFKLRGVGLRGAGRSSLWAFGLMIAAQLTLLVTTNVAYITHSTQYPSLSISTTAWLIFVLPHSIITVSITTARFTSMSKHASDNDLDAVRTDVSELLRSTIGFIMLTMFGMLVLVMPLSRLFLSDPQQVRDTAIVLALSTIWMVFFTIVFVLQRTFYALGDTRTPFLFFVFQYAVQIVLALLDAWLIPDQYLVAGLAVAQGVAIAATVPVAAMLLRRKVRFGAERARIVRSIGTFFLAGLCSFVVGIAVAWPLGAFRMTGFASHSPGTAVLTMVAVAIPMALTYLGCLVLLRSPDVQALGALVRRRG